jgi:predicted nucleotidyltransferase
MSEIATIDHGLPAYAVERLRNAFRQWPGIEAVILYGSRAKGDYRPNSDIDLCVVGESLGVKELLQLDTAIDDLLLPWKVDLSLKHQIEDPDLLAHIERVGTPLYRAE